MKPNPQDFKAFIFDLDGTITEEERREFFEGHTATFVPVLEERHGLGLDPLEVLRQKREHVEKNFRTEVFPMAVNFIKRWRGRTRLALASNSPKQFVKNALVEARMIDCFEVVCTADDVTRRKPDPEIYFTVIDRLGLQPEDVLIFEDSPVGVEAARAAGCSVVMIDNGSGRRVEGMDVYKWQDF
jgi:HAD superfamily hydrolase (TIGR01509 family)